MRKKFLAGLLAIPMTLATVAGLAGCDLLDAIGGNDSNSNSGNGGDNSDNIWNSGNGGSGITGNKVNEEQWNEVFGNEANYINYTTNLTGTVVETDDGKTQKYNARGVFQVDGNKNYTRTAVEGTADGVSLTEIYGYQAYGQNLTWVRMGEDEEFVRQVMYGLPLTNIMLADYAGCYNCFTYNSSAKRYEATEVGLRELLEVFLGVSTGGMPSGYVSVLEECSFALNNGLPVSASMTIALYEGTDSLVQTLEYSFTDYGKTTVSYPDKVANELKKMGIDYTQSGSGNNNSGSDDKKDPAGDNNKDPETPGTTTDPSDKNEPVKPSEVPTVSGDTVKQEEWVKIFEEINQAANFTADMYMDMSMVSNMPPEAGGMKVTSTSVTNQKVYTEGNKTYNKGTTVSQYIIPGMTSESQKEYSEAYGWTYNDKYYSWMSSDGKEWLYYEMEEVASGEDMILSEDYTEFYRYVTYDRQEGAYVATQAGLDILNKEIGVALKDAYAEVGMTVEGGITEYKFVIKNGSLYSINMLFEMQMSAYGTVMYVTENVAFVFSNVGKTTVTYPSNIQKDIETIRAGGTPNGGSSSGGSDNTEPSKPDYPVTPDNPSVPVNPDNPGGDNSGNTNTPSLPAPSDVKTDEVNNSSWRKAFDCIKNANYTVQVNIGHGMDAVIAFSDNSKMITMYEDGEYSGNMFVVTSQGKDYMWTSMDGKSWTKLDEVARTLDNLIVFLDGDFASLASSSYRELSSDNSCYEITDRGLEDLSKAITESEKLPVPGSGSYSVTITSCSIVIKDNNVYSIVMDTLLKAGSMTSNGTVSYYFFDIDNTTVEVPATVQKELSSLGIRA